MNGTRISPFAVIATLAVLVFSLQVFSDNKTDVDLWGNVGFVSAFPWSPDFHYSNTFSFTEPGTRWVNHEWLGEYILNRTYVRLGNTGLLGLKIALGFALLGMLYRALASDCRTGSVRFLYLLLVISTIGYGFSTRPHHFTYLMIAIMVTLFTRNARHIPAVPLLVLTGGLAVLWANFHGAFFVGAVMLAALAIIRTIQAITRREGNVDSRPPWFFAAALLVFIVASLVNPYGLRLWAFIFESGASMRPYLSEWAPFHPVRDFFSHVDFMALAALTLLGVWISPRPKDPCRIGLLILAFLAALGLRRNIPFFAIVAALTAGEHIDAAFGIGVDRIVGRLPKRILGGLLVVFIPVSLGYTVFFNKAAPLQIEVPRHKYPVETMAFMKANAIRGNALVFFDWAELCIWHLHPNVKVFLDGRFRSAYTLPTIEAYLGFLYMHGNWEDALENYPTDIVLIHRGNPAYEEMTQRPGWVEIYRSNIAALFLKADVHADVIAAPVQPPPGPALTLFP